VAELELPNPEELDEQRKDSFSKRVALVTAIFAVVLAITSLGGNNATKEMLLAQQQSSDQWAFYQSKVMREHLYRTQKMQMEATLLENRARMNPAARANYEKLVKTMDEEEGRYREEKKGIEQSAKHSEAVRDLNLAKDPYFDYGEALLQIAIVLSSISILAGSRPVFWISLVAAVSGTLFTLNGYLLLFRIPFFH